MTNFKKSAILEAASYMEEISHDKDFVTIFLNLTHIKKDKYLHTHNYISTRVYYPCKIRVYRCRTDLLKKKKTPSF